MLHNWTIGGSGSGKTALNKFLCAGLRDMGKLCAVLDPLRDGGWDADLVTHDPDEYWRWVLKKKGKPVCLFWEEAGLSIDRQDRRFDIAATTGRHAGWRIYLITQVFKQVNPVIRNQCKDRWIFNCSADDAQALYREYGRPELKDLPNLPPLHFYRARPHKPMQKGLIKFRRMRRPEIFLTDLKSPSLLIDNRN